MYNVLLEWCCTARLHLTALLGPTLNCRFQSYTAPYCTEGSHPVIKSVHNHNWTLSKGGGGSNLNPNCSSTFFCLDLDTFQGWPQFKHIWGTFLANFGHYEHFFPAIFLVKCLVGVQENRRFWQCPNINRHFYGMASLTCTAFCALDSTAPTCNELQGSVIHCTRLN